MSAYWHPIIKRLHILVALIITISAFVYHNARPARASGEPSIFEASQKDFVGNAIVDSFTAVEPYIYVDFTQFTDVHSVSGYGWPIGSTVTITVDNPNTLGIDFSGSAIATIYTWQPGISQAFLQIYSPITPGFVIQLSDGITTKTYTMPELSFVDIDPAGSLGGVTAPNSPMDVTINHGRPRASCSSATRHTVSDGSGNWSVDFSTPGAGADEQDVTSICPSANLNALSYDADNNRRNAQRHLLDTKIVVSLTDNLVSGDEWLGGKTVTLTIGAYSSSQVVQAYPGVDYGRIAFDLTGSPVTLAPGQFVSVSDGTITKSLTLPNLQITGANPSVNLDQTDLSGTADPGNQVLLKNSSQYWLPPRISIADGDGNWSGTVDSAWLDGRNSRILARVEDDDGVAVEVYWLTPHMVFNATDGSLSGYGWPEGSFVNLTRFDQNGMGNYMGSQIAGGLAGDPNRSVATFTDIMFESGMTLYMEANGWQKFFGPIKLKILNVDETADTIKGTALGRSPVNPVKIKVCHGEICSSYSIYPSSSSGNWTLDLSGLVMPWITPFDINLGDTVEAQQNDIGGNTIIQSLKVGLPPVAAFTVSPQPVHPYDWIAFDASASYDPEGGLLLFEFDFNGDGIYETSTLGSPYAYYSFPDIGTFTVSLRVTDVEGKANVMSQQIEVWPRVNQPPIALVNGPDSATEGAWQFFAGYSSYDPDGDPITFAWDLDNDGQYNDSFDSYIWKYFPDNGLYTIGLQVTDSHQASTTTQMQVNVFNSSPQISYLPSFFQLNEGGSLSSYGWFSDSGTDTWTGTVDYGDGPGALPLTLNGNSFGLNHTYADNGVYSLNVCITDDDGGKGCRNATIVVVNINPDIQSINGPLDAISIGQEIQTNAAFTDPGLLDTHTASWDWGDGSISSGLVSGHTIKGRHIYSAPGIYTIVLTVIDKDGGSDTKTYDYVVVYDPEAGFVTGSGWIKPTTNKATFEFDVKYLKGTETPTGSLVFQSLGDKLNFASTKLDWLVVKGKTVWFKGEGKLNGLGNYSFLVSVIDGTPDKFRIKIWDKATGTVVYDNRLGATDIVDPTTALGGGSIVIHK